MDVSITGTALAFRSNSAAPFSMQFDISGGIAKSWPCDSQLLLASVTNFTAEIGGVHQDLPSAFTANVVTAEYPCGSAVSFGEFVSDPMILETYQSPVLIDNAHLYDGSIGSWHIATATLTILPADPPSAVPEPSSLALLALGLAAVLAVRSLRTK
jgi:hypothetical protein